MSTQEIKIPRQALSQSRFESVRWQEITVGFNRWVTGVAIRDNPSDLQCVKHWLDNRGEEDFAKRFYVIEVVSSAAA
jgi:hypothetical protein